MLLGLSVFLRLVAVLSLRILLSLIALFSLRFLVGLAARLGLRMLLRICVALFALLGTGLAALFRRITLNRLLLAHAALRLHLVLCARAWCRPMHRAATPGAI